MGDYYNPDYVADMTYRERYGVYPRNDDDYICYVDEEDDD